MSQATDDHAWASAALKAMLGRVVEMCVAEYMRLIAELRQ